jgi:arylformamidase
MEAIETEPSSSPIFLDYSQESLDRAYDQDFWAADAEEIQARIFIKSIEVARQAPPRTMRYGSGEKQFVDIFAPAGANSAPVLIMIHGGAWRLAMREAFYGPAPAVMSAGCILVVVGFACLPAITMVEMASQIRQALVWIKHEIGKFGGDRENLNLIGHSSGAHLAAVMLTTDWTALNLPAPNIKGATLLSGLYDLYPVMLSARRRYIDLSSEQIEALSPMRNLNRVAGCVTIAWGSKDSPEFKRQSEVFAAALGGMGRLARPALVLDCNHFEILEALNEAEHPLTKTMLEDAQR